MRWLTDRVTTSPIDMKDPRDSSGYSARALMSHFRRLLLAYHPPIIRWLPAVGFAGAFLCVVLGLLAAFERIFFPASIPVEGWTSLFVMVAFSTAITVSLFGLVLDRLNGTLTRAQGRPAFMIVDRSKDALWRTEPAASAAAVAPLHAPV
jgi:hypothetical protein